jgi:hypothetical protein
VLATEKMVAKKWALESPAGESIFFQFLTRLLTRLLYGEVALSFECKAFYFVRKSSWGISEPPGEFCIEQAQKIIGGSKLTPSRYGSGTFLVR